MSDSLLVVATWGPTCPTPADVAALRAAGARRLRLNGSHLDPEALTAVTQLVALGGFHPADLIVDLQGGKTRTGRMARSIPVRRGQAVRLVPEPAPDLAPRSPPSVSTTSRTSTPSDTPPPPIPVDRPAFLAACRPGDRVALDDGRLHLRVIGAEGDALVVEPEVSGTIRSRRGLVLATERLALPPSTELLPRDRALVERALELGIGAFAISCASHPDLVTALRDLARRPIEAIAKIEQRAAFERLAALAEAADALWLCRGDLGAEVGLEHLPRWQARFLDEAPHPRLIAGQVLHHMTSSPRPTRSEACHLADLAPRIDGVVLSDETALGSRGPEAVAWTLRITTAAVAPLD